MKLILSNEETALRLSALLRSAQKSVVLEKSRELILAGRRASAVGKIGLALFAGTAVADVVIGGAGALSVYASLGALHPDAAVSAMAIFIAYLLVCPSGLVAVARDCFANRNGEHVPRWYRSATSGMVGGALVLAISFVLLTVMVQAGVALTLLAAANVLVIASAAAIDFCPGRVIRGVC